MTWGILDATGDLFLVDRLKELVVVSGFNVYPQEVEDVVREVPGVREVAVIGVEDHDTGEAVVAYVVAADSEPAALVDAVRAHCAARLARFKQPVAGRGGRCAAADRHRQGAEGPAARHRAASRPGTARVVAERGRRMIG